MRRIPIIIAYLIACAPVAAGGEEKPFTRFMIKAEFRQDALDYDDVEKRFFRESARLTFGRSSVSFTHVNVNMTAENRFTGNICLRGISPYFECIVGTYYANFGGGLLVGRKMSLSPDLFSRSLAVSRGNSFAPCSSGNPYFSFQGITAGVLYSSQWVSLSLHGFYSFRNRFVRNDRYVPGITGTTLNSILIRTKKDYRYSEPVEINDCGYSFMITAAGHWTLQSYFIHTSIRRSNNQPLLWNVDSHFGPAAEKKFYGYGFYFQYRDDYLLIFIDIAFPHRVFSSVSCGTRTVRGRGIMYGIAFRHQACSISFSGKQSDRNFYTPYSSGKSSPETVWSTAISVYPVKHLQIGGAFFSEKNRIPSGNEQYLRHARREQIFLRYDAHLKASFSARLTFAEEGKKNGTDRYLQLRSHGRLYIMKSILLNCGGTIQRKGKGAISGSFNCGIRFSLLQLFTFQLRYSRFFIKPGNALYARTSRPAGSISRGMYVKSPCNILAGELLVRFYGCRFSIEYLHQFAGSRTLRNRIEATAACMF